MAAPGGAALRNGTHSQVSEVESTLTCQLVDPLQPDVARPLEVLDSQSPIVRVLPDLLDPLRDRPLRVEGRHLRMDLGEVDLVVAGVGASTLGEANGCTGDLTDLFGDRSDLHNVLVTTHIEGLIVDQVARGL